MLAIAIDAMGGQHAPEAVVEGVAQVSLHTDIECVLVGDAPRIQRILESLAYNPAHIDIVHAADAITLEEDGREGIRRKRNSSILVAAELVARGRCAALITAGNGAAALVAALRHFQLLPGVQRVAMAGVYPRTVEHPGQDRLGLALDVGATIRCGATELVQFGRMGAAYASIISKVSAPRVALLNMRHDPAAGGEVLSEAHRRLAASPGLNFVGNIVGDELATGRADVVVCEGLLGNTVLRLLESVASAAVDLTASVAQRNWRWRAGMAIMSSGLDRLRALADYASYGGGPILGFDHLVIKAHRRSTAQSIGNAVKVAAKGVRDQVVAAVAAAVADRE